LCPERVPTHLCPRWRCSILVVRGVESGGAARSAIWLWSHLRAAARMDSVCLPSRARLELASGWPESMGLSDCIWWASIYQQQTCVYEEGALLPWHTAPVFFGGEGGSGSRLCSFTARKRVQQQHSREGGLPVGSFAVPSVMFKYSCCWMGSAVQVRMWGYMKWWGSDMFGGMGASGTV
jgi:hypothetical protein